MWSSFIWQKKTDQTSFSQPSPPPDYHEISLDILSTPKGTLEGYTGVHFQYHAAAFPPLQWAQSPEAPHPPGEAPIFGARTKKNPPFEWIGTWRLMHNTQNIIFKHTCTVMNSRWWQMFCIQIETLETYRHHCRTHATYTPPCMSVNSNTPSTFFPTTHLPSWSILYHHRPVCHVRFAWKSDSMHVASFLLSTSEHPKADKAMPLSPPCHSSACQRGLRTASQRSQHFRVVKIGKSTRPQIQIEKSPIQQASANNSLELIGHDWINRYQSLSNNIAKLNHCESSKRFMPPMIFPEF